MLGKINRLAGIAGFVFIWQIMALCSTNPALPTVSEIISELVLIMRDADTITHLASSLKIIVIGISVAIVFGITLAITMSMFDPVRIALTPLIESLRGVAALTLFPLLIVTFGLGDISRIFVIFWTSWPSILISTLNGLKTDPLLLEAAADLGAAKWQSYFRIRIPLAIPLIINGIRIGISGGFISLIAAEMLGATKGIGYMLQWSSQVFNFRAVYAYIIIIAAMGGVINWLMLIVERKVRRNFV